MYPLLRIGYYTRAWARYDIHIGTLYSGRTPLTLSVVNNLDKVVEILCVRGADKEAPNADGDVPLWLALKHELFHIAETLVAQGADVDNWTKEGNYERTLLHR